MSDVVETRWWWVRHAPVTSNNGRIYGQQDMPCDTGDSHAFDGLAKLLRTEAFVDPLLLCCLREIPTWPEFCRAPWPSCPPLARQV